MANKGRYTLNEGIYIPHTQVEFSYSDGDASETYLLETIKAAKDITTGSEELFTAIKDWPSQYHLTPKRADLLRPFSEILKGKSVLEIGCGCGAVTRYLGELGCNVVALEGSNRRARISKERCHDLENVTIVNDTFSNFSWPEAFDFVTLIGVLEYSSLYINAPNPPLQLLEQARSFLTSAGGLLVAIENKLGLKYWAGAPEDHTGRPYFGIENHYTTGTAITFGRLELQALLQKSGFADTKFFYPFPDYKIPDVIITEAGLQQKTVRIENLLAEKFDYMQGTFFWNTFATTLAATSLHENGLIADFANSFLVLSYVNQPVEQAAANHAAYIYNTLRKKPYCKQTLITAINGQEAFVTRSYLYPAENRGTNLVNNRLTNESYTPGHLLFNELIPVISRTGWGVTDLVPWTAEYYTFLKTHAWEKEDSLWLDGQYLDLTPFNILVTDAGTFTSFDQEWIYTEPLPLYYIFFRGLMYSLGRIRYYASPAAATPLNNIDLATALIQQFITFNETHLEDCRQREEKLFEGIALGNASPFSHTAIFARRNFELESEQLRVEVLSLEKEKEQTETALLQIKQTSELLTAKNHALHGQLQEMAERNQTLQGEKDKLQQHLEWYKSTYENRSLLGILKDRLTRKH